MASTPERNASRPSAGSPTSRSPAARPTTGGPPTSTCSTTTPSTLASESTSLEGGEGPGDALGADRSGGAHRLGERADAQLLQEPAGVDDVLRHTAARLPVEDGAV